jgi:hypothetical protein
MHEKGLNDSDFTKALDEIISHAFEKKTVTENQQLAEVLKLKTIYNDLTGHEFYVLEVGRWLQRAYDAYHAGDTRPLDYEMYKMFVTACHELGAIMNNQKMMELYLETPEEHRTGGRQKTKASAGAAVPGKDDAQTQAKERLRELLQRLKEIVEDYAEK